MKNKFKRYTEEICSNCKNKEKADCKIVERIDNTIYCEFYKRANKAKKKKKRYIDVTAKQNKPIMKGLV